MLIRSVTTYLIVIVSLAVAGYCISCSPTEPSDVPPGTAILLVFGFSGVDTLTIDAGTGIPVTAQVGLFDLNQFDSVQVRLSATPIPAGKLSRFAVSFDTSAVIADTLSISRSYVAGIRTIDFPRPDSVVVLFTVLAGRTKFSEFTVYGWQR